MSKWYRLPALIDAEADGRWSVRTARSENREIITHTAMAVWESADGDDVAGIAVRLRQRGLAGVDEREIKSVLEALARRDLVADRARGGTPASVLHVACLGFDDPALGTPDFMLWALAVHAAVVPTTDIDIADVVVAHVRDGSEPPLDRIPEDSIRIAVTPGDARLPGAWDAVVRTGADAPVDALRVPPWAPLLHWWPGSDEPLSLRMLRQRRSVSGATRRAGWALYAHPGAPLDPALTARLHEIFGPPVEPNLAADFAGASKVAKDLQFVVSTGSGPDSLRILLLAWLGGAVPVFCGPAAAIADLNPNAVVAAEQYAHPAHVADYLDWLMAHDRAALVVREEPLFYNNTPPTYARTETLGNRLWQELAGQPESGDDRLSGEPQRQSLLTVGMATADDYDGVYFSIQALRLYHSEAVALCEFLVLDNNPDGPCGEALRSLCDQVPSCRYLPVTDQHGTAVRDRIFRAARTEYVLCLDCHVMLVPGALDRLLAYFQAHPDTRDLIQGPLVFDGLASTASQFREEWRAGMYGVWEHDPAPPDADAEPFEIRLQGLGLFASRRDAWPGFNPDFRGFGGEEGYIHEKYRQRGQRTLCLPGLQWLHRFGRPGGVPYRIQWEDRIRNYLIGWRELGLDTAPVRDHFAAHVGPEIVWRVEQGLKIEASHPFWAFDAVFCINLDAHGHRWQAMQKRFRKLGVEDRVRRFPGIATADNHHIGCMLSHRAILELARDSGWRSVLVFEDDVLFRNGALFYLERSIAELRTVDWRVFYPGYVDWSRRPRGIPGREHLLDGRGVTTTHAVAYHCSVFDELLTNLPATIEECRNRIEAGDPPDKWVIDRYLATLEDGIYLAHPAAATQMNLRPYLPPEERDDYLP